MRGYVMEREQDFDNEIEIDLKDLFLEIISYWQWIILVTIATGAVAFAISRFMITPMYESTSELYVLSKSTSITSLADIQTGTSLTNDYIVVVKGRPVLDQVIEKSDLKLPHRADRTAFTDHPYLFAEYFTNNLLIFTHHFLLLCLHTFPLHIFIL